ncbi:unnamed protein product [Candidula unifasciata]|uniref:Uncharacterized protein n=1 Tax=Candidula unifasciata TaxID=100452 RepID=A0A8S3ZZV7_9EUPU|nr:unnamed protein product [Candidula unifasciata]
MATVTTQICLLLSAVYSLVYSQLAQPIDPNLGNAFGQPFIPGGGFDPNFIPNAGLFPTDPNAFPNTGNPGFPGTFPNTGNPGFPGTFPSQPAPLPRPNPMQSLLPLFLLRGGGDMAQMFALSSMMGGGGGFGAGGINPLMLMMLGGM